MAFKGKAVNSKGGEGGGDYPKAPPGNHPACLVAIVDLGTQRARKFQSEETEEVHKIFLLWELVEEKIPGVHDNFVIGRDYKLSYHEKSALRLMMEGWRNKAYQEGDEIDVGAALGRKCLLSVKNRASKSDPKKSYPQIEGVSGVPKGMKVSDPLNAPVAWELGEHELHELPAFVADYYHYGQSIKEWVEDSKEWKSAPAGEGEGEMAPAAAPGYEVDDGEIPF